MNLSDLAVRMQAKIFIAIIFLLSFTSFATLEAQIAEDSLLQVVSPDEFSEAHLRLGVDFYLTNELEVAIREFREAVRQRPGYAQAYHNLGVTLAKTGDLAGAVAAWSEAERLDPLVVSVRYRTPALVAYNHGVSLLLNKRLTEAMDQWEEALRWQPDFIEAHYALGMG